MGDIYNDGRMTAEEISKRSSEKDYLDTPLFSDISGEEGGVAYGVLAASDSEVLMTPRLAKMFKSKSDRDAFLSYYPRGHNGWEEVEIFPDFNRYSCGAKISYLVRVLVIVHSDLVRLSRVLSVVPRVREKGEARVAFFSRDTFGTKLSLEVIASTPKEAVSNAEEIVKNLRNYVGEEMYSTIVGGYTAFEDRGWP